MKTFYILIPFLVGGLTILQSGLNRTIGLQIGWPAAGIMNNVVGSLFALLIIFVLLGFFNGAGVGRPQEISWWWIIPGLCGISFVMGIPLAVQELGASKTFVILVGSQILFSVLWDAFVLGLAVPWHRLAGVVLAGAGAFLTIL